MVPMLRLLAFAVSLLMLSSCATVFAKHERKIMVTSNPPGADIYVNGVAKGVTPARITVSNHDNLAVAIRKEGFHGGGCYVNTSIAPIWVILDLVLIATVVPLVVDLITHNWSRLDSSYCTANLAPLRQ
jgi:hypothetical protein